MRLSVTVLTGTLLTGSLVACSNGYSVPQTPSISADGSASKTSVAPVELRSSSILAKIYAAAGHGRSDAVTPGIYAEVGSLVTGPDTIYAYPDPDSSNGPPVCSVGPVQIPSSLAVDRKGDLLAATNSGSSAIITIFKGPGLCGPELGSISNPYGNFPTDVASRDAQNGRIVVGNESGIVHRRAGVTVCTLSGGCTANLMAPLLRNVDNVAIAPNGDCWATGWEGTGNLLFYFAQCRHRGVVATGFQAYSETTVLDIDGNGNLVSIRDGHLYIYSGCNPSCKVVGGPFQLHGSSREGHLDASSKQFVAADTQYNQLDIYSYSTSGIKYKYSITNGLSSGVNGAAFSPPSKE